MTRGSTGPEWGQLYRAEAPQCHLSGVCRYTHGVSQCVTVCYAHRKVHHISKDAHSCNYMNMIHKKTDTARNTHTKTHRSFQPLPPRTQKDNFAIGNVLLRPFNQGQAFGAVAMHVIVCCALQVCT